MANKYANKSLLKWQGPFSKWFFSRGRHNVSAGDINYAKFFIGISLRNPSFSNAWLDSALGDIRHFKGTAFVALVDKPYESSISATAENDLEIRQKLTSFYNQASEQKRRVERIVLKHKEYSSLVTWDYLESITPDNIVAEINSAFLLKKNTYSLILEQVSKVFPETTSHYQLERMSKFLIDEVPVLLNVYYKKYNGCIDVYPGPQARLFWEIDKGNLRSELPLCSKLAESGKSHTYAQVSLL